MWTSEHAGAVAQSSIAGNRMAGATILLGLVAVGGLAPWLAGIGPDAIAGAALHAPGPGHWFGTDDLGRDLYSAVLHGARTSLITGLVAAALSTSIAVLVGGTAAVKGGAIDHVLMRGTEFMQSLPRFFLIVLIVSLFGSFYRVIVIGLTTWPSTARVFRAQALAILKRDFVLAARASGGTDAAILRRHVWPLALPVLAAEAAYAVGGAILAEAGLGFLGLGDPSVVSWGALLGSAQHFVREAWWMSIFPGAAITVTVIGCNLLAESLIVRRG
jgi:peptide/nickel transport system permease protein